MVTLITMFRLLRRLPWLGLTLLSLTLATAHAARSDTPTVATLDWTIAETLVALGVTPHAVAQVDAYHDWVGEPPLPDSVIDLGLRTQPNLELLASLEPDRILISPMFANLTSRLSRIAPVENLALYTPQSDTWEQMGELTRQVARLVERPHAGERLIETTEAHLASLRNSLGDDHPPLLIIQFMDERHVRVFGEHGLYQAVLDRLGLTNAWQGPTNYWGFSLVGIESLVDIDAQLVVVEPYPVGVEPQLTNSGLWQNLPSVRDGTLITLPSVWSFGALPSAKRFATELVAALEGDDAL
ncbi:ABC transporter substrate-binding protein [Litchfieldella qijiaojingensis]|uniref:ABC transporter substrate-binding protein n=1 Tax=Litchfieldella qijiaojingensis TaxID=980347 RepID=A0ABQ2ZCM7_9GAMM|nr:ABC transporter substrate-binding protein [Halomonas qijiaojingensis]GGY09496.1 ABC transporter substrate-binding protein [Halomonas qijiaojingensis]